jgi:hypothetical protein
VIRLSAIAGLLFAVALTALGADEQAAPEVVVERHLSSPGRMTRTTLFDNRMAVTTVRESGVQVFFRQITLAQHEYDVYMDVLRSVSQLAGREAKQRIAGDRIEGVVRLNLPGLDPRTITYSPVQVFDLATNRLITMLDDLENRVARVSPSEEALRHWTPMVGDRVLLFSGQTAMVGDVSEDGALSLEHETEGLIELVPSDGYHKVIQRVLEHPR